MSVDIPKLIAGEDDVDDISSVSEVRDDGWRGTGAI
jgi:hypothetical protein